MMIFSQPYTGVITAALFGVCLTTQAAEAPAHGQFHPDNKQQVWDESVKRWISPLTFWHNYANSRGGLTYGPTRTYPPYEQLKEGDTLMIELDSGSCLMEFFHARWRRANDVRRWDPAFNQYAGCPHVFD